MYSTRARHYWQTELLCYYAVWKIGADCHIFVSLDQQTAWITGRSIPRLHYGPGVALMLAKDFLDFERFGVIMQPEDKDAALLPRRIDGRWALIHRPVSATAAHIWISYSTDMREWGSAKMILKARFGGWWDANKIGLSPPLIETSQGWLMIYHGVKNNGAGVIYRLGLALFDLNEPERCLKRGDEWMFGPEESYELHGDVDKVVFPCGYTLAPDGVTPFAFIMAPQIQV